MRIFQGHTGRVRGVAYAPDSLTLASCGEDGTVRTWNLETGRLIWKSGSDRGSLYDQTVYEVAYSPDGRWLAAALHDKQVRVWSGDDEPRVFHLHRNLVSSVAFLDSRTLFSTSGNSGGALAVTDLDQGVQRILSEDQHGIWSIAIHQGSGLVAVGSTAESDAIRLWHHDEQRFDAERLPGNRVRSLAFSPDGLLLAQSNLGGVASVWDLEGDREKFTLRGHQDRIRSVAFSPDGESLATASDDGTVRLWDMDRGTERARFDWEMGRLGCVAFAPDGMTIAGGGDRDLVVWDVEI